jgi:hypothetical protein
VTLHEVSGHILVNADELGTCAPTRLGFLYLPPSIRRWCGLETGVRVLLVGDPTNQQLIVHPLAALDDMFRDLRLKLNGGKA